MSHKIGTLAEWVSARGYQTTMVRTKDPNISESVLGRGFDNILTTDHMLDASLPDWIHVLDSVKESNDKHKPAFVFFHTDSVHNYNDDSWRTQMSYSLSPQYLPPQFTPALPRELIAGVKDWVETNSHVQLGNATQAEYLKWYTTLKLDSGYGMIKKIYEQLPLYDRSYITAEIALKKLQTKNPNLFITLCQVPLSLDNFSRTV